MKKVMITLLVYVLLSGFLCIESPAQTEWVTSKDTTRMVELKAGMTVEEVVTLLGEPDDIDTHVGKNGEQVLMYFYLPTPKDMETRKWISKEATADSPPIAFYWTSAKPNYEKPEPIKKLIEEEKNTKIKTDNSPYYVTFINGKVSKIDRPKIMTTKNNPKH